MKSPRNETEIKQIFSEFRKRNRSDGEMEIAPLRSLDDFILSKARFQLPNLNDSNKWPNRVINNLMYYQTNYFLLNCVIFVTMALVIIMARAFIIVFQDKLCQK